MRLLNLQTSRHDKLIWTLEIRNTRNRPYVKLRAQPRDQPHILTEWRVESFVDDLNTRWDIVSSRVALLPWSTEIQPYVALICLSPHTQPPHHVHSLSFFPDRGPKVWTPLERTKYASRPFNESTDRDPSSLVATILMSCLKNMSKAWKLRNLTQDTWHDMKQDNKRDACLGL